MLIISIFNACVEDWSVKWGVFGDFCGQKWKHLDCGGYEKRGTNIPSACPSYSV